MNAEVIRSYLVGLGFEIDNASYRRWDEGLKKAADAVQQHTSGIVKDLLTWQTAIVGAFTGISAGVVGLVDHVADADQQFRLFGLRMFLSTDQARKLQIGMSALGASMEELAWDPELHRRFEQLSADQDKLTRQLGPNFEQNMRSIRDLRFEVTRLQVSLKYLAMQFSESLFRQLGITIPEVQAKLKAFVESFQSAIPAIADKLAADVIPVLKDTWYMLQAMWGAAKEFFVIFDNVIGLLSGDKSIEGTAFGFDKLAGAIEHVVSWMSQFFQSITLAEKVIVHLLAGVALAMNHHGKEAINEFKQAFNDLTGGSAGIFGMAGGALAGGAIAGSFGAEAGATAGTFIGGPFGTVIGGALGAFLAGGAGTVLGAGAGGGLGVLAGRLKQHFFPTNDQTADLAPVIAAAAVAMGLDPRLALSVAQQESGMHQYGPNGLITSGAGAQGVMQLMPGTARILGVDPTDASQNIAGGVGYLAQLVQKYHGDLRLALASYNWGSGNVDKYLHGQIAMPASVSQYADQVLAREQNIDVGGIHIVIQNPANAKEAYEAAHRGTMDALQKSRQSTISQLHALAH